MRTTALILCIINFVFLSSLQSAAATAAEEIEKKKRELDLFKDFSTFIEERKPATKSVLFSNSLGVAFADNNARQGLLWNGGIPPKDTLIRHEENGRVILLDLPIFTERLAYVSQASESELELRSVGGMMDEVFKSPYARGAQLVKITRIKFDPDTLSYRGKAIVFGAASPTPNKQCPLEEYAGEAILHIAPDLFGTAWKEIVIKTGVRGIDSNCRPKGRTVDVTFAFNRKFTALEYLVATEHLKEKVELWNRRALEEQEPELKTVEEMESKMSTDGKTKVAEARSNFNTAKAKFKELAAYIDKLIRIYQNGGKLTLMDGINEESFGKPDLLDANERLAALSEDAFRKAMTLKMKTAEAVEMAKKAGQ